MKNSNKCITATANGIVISFCDDKPKFIRYSDSIKSIQLLERKEYQTRILNKTQKRIYSEALYGIKIYNDIEIMKLPMREIRRITYINKLTQIILNRWKQEIVTDKIDKFLSVVFHKSKITKIPSIKYNDKWLCHFTFKEIGITQEMIIDKLIKEKILPQNFYEIK